MLREVRKHSSYFLKNGWFMVALCISALAGYGYVLTHGTCGIDDISIDLYFEKGIGVAIGRWPYYLINKVIPVAEYTPFIGDFITVVLLMIAAVMWCVLIRMLIPKELPIWAYMVYVVLFMDYSMNADVFVFYLQNGLGWLHLFVVLSLIAFLYLYKNHIDVKKQILIRIGVIFMLTMAISFYESAANLFLSGIMLVILIDLYMQKEISSFRGKRFVMAIFFAGRYLVYGMIARRVVRSLIMHVFPVTEYAFYRSTSSISWIIKGGIGRIWENITGFLMQLYCDYFAIAPVYYPILLFVICTIVFIGTVVYVTLQRRDWLFGLTGIGMYLSMFVLCVIQGDALEYRACQIFTIFVAFVFGAIAVVLANASKYLRIAGSVLLLCAMMYSIYDMNQWFVLDYDKTEYEMSVIDEIAEELQSGRYSIEEKPLVVVGDFELPEELYERYCITEEHFAWDFVKNVARSAKRDVKENYCYAQNQSSIIDWSVHAFALHCGYNVPISQFFAYRGYEFNWANAEIMERVFNEYYPLDIETYSYAGIANYTETYSGAAQYPADGYIEELEDCIVIRL